MTLQGIVIFFLLVQSKDIVGSRVGYKEWVNTLERLPMVAAHSIESGCHWQESRNLSIVLMHSL